VNENAKLRHCATPVNP